MMAKRSKYDTNPLDPKVATRAEQTWGATRSAPDTEKIGGPTSEITADEAARSHPDSETPTRLIGDDLPTSYPSIFIPSTYQGPAYQPPAAQQTQSPVYQAPPTVYQSPPVYQTPAAYQPLGVYQPSALAALKKASTCKVAGLGIPERWATILPYLPGYIGAVLAAIELFIVPRGETRTRFHAAQGLALQLAIMAISLMFRFVSIGLGSSIGGGLFRFAAFVFLIISIIRVWQGKPHQIAPLTDASNWLNQRIAPRG